MIPACDFFRKFVPSCGDTIRVLSICDSPFSFPFPWRSSAHPNHISISDAIRMSFPCLQAQQVGVGQIMFHDSCIILSLRFWSLSVLSCHVFVCISPFFLAFSCHSLFFFFRGVALHPILSPYRMPSALFYPCLHASGMLENFVMRK